MFRFLCQTCFHDVIYIFLKNIVQKCFSNVSKMAHFDIIITLKKHYYEIWGNIFLMFLKHYCVWWECFNDVLKTSLKNVKLRYLKNICMMFLKFYITFYLHLRNVIEKCFRYNMYITFIKCYKNVMCLLGGHISPAAEYVRPQWCRGCCRLDDSKPDVNRSWRRRCFMTTADADALVSHTGKTVEWSAGRTVCQPAICRGDG